MTQILFVIDCQKQQHPQCSYSGGAVTNFYRGRIVKMTNDEIREVCNALIRLTGVSKTQAARRVQVNPSNANSWLNGEEQKLSLENQLKILSALGVRYGLLRRDMVHEWIVGNDVSDVKLVLEKTGNSRFDIEEGNDIEQPCRIRVYSPLGGSPIEIKIKRPLMVEPPRPISELLTEENAEREKRRFKVF